jgi:large subunit ribosomal protein L31
MKAAIHPKYEVVKVTCSCGHQFDTRSTMATQQLNIEVCSQCHPFYTGKQKLVDTGGRVQRFRDRYKSRISQNQAGQNEQA